jgi:hypothetical protein
MDKEVPGGSKPMATWEKWYWGAGVVAVSVLLFKYLSYKPPKTPEELEVGAGGLFQHEMLPLCVLNSWHVVVLLLFTKILCQPRPIGIVYLD